MNFYDHVHRLEKPLFDDEETLLFECPKIDGKNKQFDLFIILFSMQTFRVDERVN